VARIRTMPRRFRNFLKKKDSKRRPRQKERYSSESSDQCSDEDDYDDDSMPVVARKQRFSFHNNKSRKEKALDRSSKSLGDAEVNGRLMTFLESDEFDVSEEEDTDHFEDMKHIERKYSIVGKKSEDEDDDDDDDDGEASNGGLQELDRACVRLDGIEVYAIVSALTCATAISCFDNYDPTPLSVILKERAVFTMLAEFFYYVTGAWGMMTGLHATLIFSLVTMYGRTAVGIDRDEAFNIFFQNTAQARFHGFNSFKHSLYCFMTQLTFLIGQKFFFAPLRPLVLLFTAYIAYTTIYVDSQQVLSAAGVIYRPDPPPNPPEEDDPVESGPGDRRGSGDRRRGLQDLKNNRRGSMRNKSFSISTRVFGSDTGLERRSSLVNVFNSAVGTD